MHGVSGQPDALRRMQIGGEIALIRRYQIKMLAEADTHINSSLAYSFYGELMRHISCGFADQIHEQGFTPISQFAESTGGSSFVWHVSLFGGRAVGEVSPFLDRLSSVSLDDKDITLHVDSTPEIIETDLREILMNASKSEEEYSQREIRLITPTTFKSAGEYVLFPSASLVIRSLVSSWNALQGEIVLDDEDMLRMLHEGIRISGYRLFSTTYRMKGQHIPSFTGSLRFRSRLSAPLKNIWEALLLFGEYSGMGIKTALGMGGYKIN